MSKEKENYLEQIEEFKEKNTALRFLSNLDQLQSGAMLRLQWCIAPQVVEYLREKRITRAKMFITIRDPRGYERRLVRPLTSPQELVEFHCPGTHTILGTIVWGSKIDESVNAFEAKSDRHEYEHCFENSISKFGSTSFGEAELLAQVADGFFAPEMSPWMSWWVNLWFGEAWDGCDIKRRTIIAFTIQPVLLALWIPFITLVRLFGALWASVVLMRQNVHFENVVHPFACDTDSTWCYSWKRWQDKPLRRLLWVPLNHLGFMLAAACFTFAVSGFSEATFPLFMIWYLAVLTAAILIVTGKDPFTRLRDLSRKKNEREQRDLVAENFKQYYPDELFCTLAPPDGTLRAKRQGVVSTVVLAYHDLKARTCKPLAR